MGADVKISLHQRERKYFTNDDVVRGEVTLSTSTSVSLNCIQVKLEGVSSTQMLIPDPKSRKPRDKILHDSHKFLYVTAIVFPPENVREVSSSKDFTLGPGTYTYPFELRFPRSSGCTRISGFSNLASINKKSRSVVLNNGNFGVDHLKNSAAGYIQSFNNPNLRRQQEQKQEEALRKVSYHVETPLPPTFNHDGGSCSIHYFVKVTCKRSSLLKQNYRKSVPFNFRPLDIESYRNESTPHKEAFFRREVVFQNRNYSPNVENIKDLPKVPAREGFFRSIFGTGRNESQSSDFNRQSSSRKQIPYGFEVRLKAGASFVPGRPPPLKLYFVSENDPATFSLSQYGKGKDSNGLGVVYVQSLSIELESITTTSVLEAVYGKEIHEEVSTESIPLCKNVYDNLKFDLINATSMSSSSTTSHDYVSPSSYELEIPRHFYENCRVPKNIVPAFQICNITRSYKLVVLLAISSEPVENNSTDSRSLASITIVCPDIRVLSGLKPHSAISPTKIDDNPPQLPERNPHNSPARRSSIEKGEHLFQSESRQNYNIDAGSRVDNFNSSQGQSISAGQSLDANAEAPPPSYNDVLRDISQ